jgi:hypothetical protein
MGAWAEAHDPPDEERSPEPEADDGENVVDFSTHRLREWLRGMFGGEASRPPDDE